MGEGVNLLEDLVAIFKSVCQEICLQKLGKGRYTSIFSDGHQICQSGNLLEEMGESACRFSDCHQICQSANSVARIGEGVNLLEDLVAVIKSASHQIC